MKTLVETSLFDLFASYINGAGPAAGELPAAYDDFVDRLAALSPEGDLVGQLRRLNYTKIELTFMRQACDGMAAGCRHILYDVFIGKTLALLDAEAEMLKEMLRHGGMSTGFKAETVHGNGKRTSVTLTWNGTDSDLIELVAALMAAGAVGTTEGRELKIVDVIRVFEEVFHLKINALYTKRGKVFDRCTDTTPFIDSLRRSYNRMLDARWRKGHTPTTANGRLACARYCGLAGERLSLRRLFTSKKTRLCQSLIIFGTALPGNRIDGKLRQRNFPKRETGCMQWPPKRE